MDEVNRQTPETLYNALQKTVIGQDQYLKDLCTAAWMHNLRYQHFLYTGETIDRPKQNILCLGPSGSGKTLAVQTIGQLLDLPVIIADASALTGAGWKGTNVSSMIARALQTAKNDAEAVFSIVCLDEIDKVFKSSVTDPSFKPINNLLTFLAGGVITHCENNQTVSLDTSYMLIVCLGAFEGLEKIIHKRLYGAKSIGFLASSHEQQPEKDLFESITEADLHEYGIPTEFLGRISLITRTKQFTSDTYRKILTESKASPIQQYNSLLNPIGVHVSISDAAIAHAAQQAQQSSTGARQLSRTVASALQPAIYKTGSDESIDSIMLDVTNGRLAAKYTYNGRPERQWRGQGDIYRLGDIERDILYSVPFDCNGSRGSILMYVEQIKKPSRSKLTGLPENPEAAACIIATAICSQLLDPENDTHTMLTLYKKIDMLSQDAIPDKHFPLAQMYNDYLNKAIEYTADFGNSKKIAKYLLLAYCKNYLAQIEKQDA